MDHFINQFGCVEYVKKNDDMEKRVEFKNEYDEKLAGLIHLPEIESEKGVVFGHCFTCSMHTRILKRISTDLETAGFYVLRFDFSGNGRSEGDFRRSSYSKQISDMNTAIEYLGSYGVSSMGLLGHSLGAVVSLLTFAEHSDKLKTICCLAGRLINNDPRRFFNSVQLDELKQKGRFKIQSRGRLLTLDTYFFDDAFSHHPSKALSRLKKPLLIVHGDADETIPANEAQKAFKWSPKGSRLAIINGADHMFTQEKIQSEVSSIVLGWFRERV